MRRMIWTLAAVSASAVLVIGSAVAQGMTSVTLGVNIGGAEADGKVTIKDSNGTVVAEGKAGKALAVPAGRYDVFIQCTALADKPTYVNRGFQFTASENYQCNKTFMAADVTLVATKGGRRINGDIVLQRQGGGEPVAKVKSGVRFRISPGRYQGVFKQGRSEFNISGLQFMDGATQEVPIAF